MLVTDVRAKKILNSRREQTIEVIVRAGKLVGVGKAPSGASKGIHEVVAFPKGVDWSVKLVNTKVKKLLNGFKFEKFEDLKKVESKLAKIKSLGGNAVIALEFALLNCLAREKGKPLWKILNPRARRMPMPLANVVGGGEHTRKKGVLDVQEILLLPRTKTFAEAVRINTTIYQQLAVELKRVDRKFKKEKTDEKAWITYLTELEVLSLLNKVIKKFDVNVRIGIDFAASRLFRKKRYVWEKLSKLFGEMRYTRAGEIDLICALAERFDIYYLEDPLQEEDFAGFKELTKRLRGRLVCGDDLTVTNPNRVKRAIKERAMSAVIIKPNQVGSLIKAKQAIDIAKKAGVVPIVSHRSGETDDATVAHLAVAWGAPIVKFGVAGPERLAKLNELIKIEKEIK